MQSAEGGHLGFGSHASVAQSAAGTAAAEAPGAPSHPWQPVHACVTSCLLSHPYTLPSRAYHSQSVGALLNACFHGLAVPVSSQCLPLWTG